MTHGFLAPQFGLVGDRDQQRKQQPRQADTAHPQSYSSPFLPQTGPTVVIRRRRRLIGTGGLEGKEASPSVGDGVRPAVKTPKVYRLESSSAAGPVSTAQPLPTTSTMSSEPLDETPPVVQTPTVAPQRRKRDTLRAPRLLSHVVFERPEPEAAEGASPASAAVQLPDFSSPGDGQSDYEGVCRALERVRDELKAALQARRFRALSAMSP